MKYQIIKYHAKLCSTDLLAPTLQFGPSLRGSRLGQPGHRLADLLARAARGGRRVQRSSRRVRVRGLELAKLTLDTASRENSGEDARRSPVPFCKSPCVGACAACTEYSYLSHY